MAIMAADGNGRRRGEREARERGGGGRAATGGWARGGRTPRPTHAAKRSTRQRARRLSELRTKLGDRALKKYRSHIDASHSRQPLVKGERLVRAEMNAVILIIATTTYYLLGAFATVRPMRTWSLSLLTSCACLRAGARPDGFLRVNAHTRRVQRKI